jgi:uncharacterized protein YecE (DUF72 family)
MKWHIGCSGYHYREWKEVFYPPGLPQRKWFEFYCSKFDTIELNNTFYRFPELKSLQNWYTISPAEFSFSVKAPRLITHYKQFNDCESLLGDFYEVTRNGLKEKLGAVLFQLPPKFTYEPERLELITKSMRPGYTNVIEFRHESWWKAGVYESLEKANIIFCGISHPTLPGEAVINNTTAYYRFHGVPKLYYSVYGKEALQKVADHLLAAGSLKQAYIYYNNTAATGAIENAAWLKQYLGIG